MGRPAGSIKTPSYRLHKATGQAIVQFNGEKPVYLGKFDTAESRQRYDREIAEWLLRGKQGRSSTQSATITQLIAGYMTAVEMERKRPIDPRAKTALSVLNDIYGETPASEFNAQKLMALRLKLATQNAKNNFHDRLHKKPLTRTLSRRYSNALISYIKKAFKWAASTGIVPASVWVSVAAVENWKRGEGAAIETKEVLPANIEDVEAVLEIANPVLKAMILVQLHTGMRASEVCRMRPIDLDMTKPVWEYRPSHHKTMGKVGQRVIYIGPRAQEAIRPFLRPDVSNAIFRPEDSERNRSHIRMKKAGPSITHSNKFPRQTTKHSMYKTVIYANLIYNGCARADKLAHMRRPDIPKEIPIVNRWCSHQLRHLAATRLREQYGLEVAQTTLGHTSAAMTERYARPNLAAAKQAMSEVG